MAKKSLEGKIGNSGVQKVEALYSPKARKSKGSTVSGNDLRTGKKTRN